MDWLEGRRLRAWDLLEAGWRQVEVAEVFGVTKGAVSQWVKRAREGGREALRRHPAPGARSKLSPEQVGQLPTLLSRGGRSLRLSWERVDSGPYRSGYPSGIGCAVPRPS